MCMIAHRPVKGKKQRGANMPNAVIDLAMERHPDGFGVAWREANALRYEKFGPTEKAAFRKLLKAVDARRDIEYVAHFRFATHGPEVEELAHPFVYSDPDPEVGDVLVFHNGIISCVSPTKDESDTQVFVRDILAKLPSKWWDNEAIASLVDSAAGWSRILLMTNDETVNLNFASGDEDGGLWYSSAHKPYATQGVIKYHNGTVGGGYYRKDDDWEAEGWGYTGSGWEKKYTETGGSWNKPSDTATTRERMLVGGSDVSPRSNNAEEWAHMGHVLTPLQDFEFDKDGDYEASVLCATCGTAGDVYIIDGKAYIDISHAGTVRGVTFEDDEVDQDLLPGLPGVIPVSRAVVKAH